MKVYLTTAPADIGYLRLESGMIPVIWKRANASTYQYQHMKNPNYLGMGIALGAGVGIALGVAFGNIAVGLAAGIGAGVAIGYSLSQKKDEGETDQE